MSPVYPGLEEREMAGSAADGMVTMRDLTGHVTRQRAPGLLVNQPDISPTEAAQIAAARQGTVFPQPGTQIPKPKSAVLMAALHGPPLPSALTSMDRPSPRHHQSPSSQSIRFDAATLERDSHNSSERTPPNRSSEGPPSNAERDIAVNRQVSSHSMQSFKSNRSISSATSRSNGRKAIVGAFTKTFGAQNRVQALQALVPAMETSRMGTGANISRAMDDEPGEARRNTDGTHLSMLETLDDMGGGGGVRSSQGYLPQKEGATDMYSIMRYRSSLLGLKGTVETHQRRMKEREEVMRTLTAWTTEVMANRAPGLLASDMEHVDAEQLELEERCTDLSLKPEAQGLGRQLRQHWNDTVQAAVEVKFAQMRDKWDADMACEMEELRDLRSKNKDLSGALRDNKDKLMALQMKFDLVVRQGKPAPTPAPAPAAAPNSADALPLQSPEAMAAAANVDAKSRRTSESRDTAGDQEAAADTSEFVAEITRLRELLANAQKEQQAAVKNATQAMDTLEGTLNEKQQLEQALNKSKTDIAMVTLKLDETKAELAQARGELEKQKKLTKLQPGSSVQATAAPVAKGRNVSPPKEPRASSAALSKPTRSIPAAASTTPATRTSSPPSRTATSTINATTNTAAAVTTHTSPTTTGTSKPTTTAMPALAASPRTASGGCVDHSPAQIDACGPEVPGERSALVAQGPPDERASAKASRLQREAERLSELALTLNRLLDEKNTEIRRLAAELADLRARSPSKEHRAVSPRGTVVRGDPALMARVAKAEAELTVARSRTQEVEEELMRTRRDLEEARASPVTANQLEVAVEVERTRRRQLLDQLQVEVAGSLEAMYGEAEGGAAVANRVAELRNAVMSLVSQHSVGLEQVTQVAPRALASSATAAQSRMRTRGITFKPADLQGLLANSNAKLQKLYEMGGVPTIRPDMPAGAPTNPLVDNPLIPAGMDTASGAGLGAGPNSYSQRLNQWLSSAFSGAAGSTGAMRMSCSGAAGAQRTSLSGAAVAAMRVSMASGHVATGHAEGELSYPRMRQHSMLGTSPLSVLDSTPQASMGQDPATGTIFNTMDCQNPDQPSQSQVSRHKSAGTSKQADDQHGPESPTHWKRMSVVGDESMTVARRQHMLGVANATHSIDETEAVEQEGAACNAGQGEKWAQRPAASLHAGSGQMPQLPLSRLGQGTGTHSSQSSRAPSHRAGDIATGQSQSLQLVPDLNMSLDDAGMVSQTGSGQPQSNYAMQPSFVPPRLPVPGRAAVKVHTVVSGDAPLRPLRPLSALVPATHPSTPGDTNSKARPASAAPSGDRLPSTFARLHASYLPPEGSAPQLGAAPAFPQEQGAPGSQPSRCAAGTGSDAVRPLSARPAAPIRWGVEEPQFTIPAEVFGVSSMEVLHGQALRGTAGAAAPVPADAPRRPAQWGAQQLHEAQERVRQSYQQQKGEGATSSGGGDAAAAAHAASMQWQPIGASSRASGSPPRNHRGGLLPSQLPLSEADVAGPSPLVLQQQVGGEPAVLRHNVYQPQADQPAGAFKVRLITATPQKGIQHRRPDSPGTGGMRPNGAMSLGLNYEPGQGPPQLAPAPEPAMLSTRVGYNMGLSVPSHTWTLQPAGAPAGSVLHVPGDERPMYSGVEMMSRMELVSALRAMQQNMDELQHRHSVMSGAMSQEHGLRSELAAEVAEARQHWVAENQYNTMLQEELERMQAILEMITHTAHDIAGLDTLHQGEEEQSAPASEPAVKRLSVTIPTAAGIGAAAEAVGGGSGGADSPEAVQARALMDDLARIHAQQEAHVQAVEALAEDMGLESPTHSPASPKRSPSSHKLPHRGISRSALHAGVFAGQGGDPPLLTSPRNSLHRKRESESSDDVGDDQNKRGHDAEPNSN